MYLHFIDDVSQINHFIKRTNELFPNEHLFLVVSSNPEFEKVKNAGNIQHFYPNTKNIERIAREMNGYQAVFIHNLCYHKARIILNSPHDIIFIWGVWGFDYYYVYPRLFSEIFLPYTRLANLGLFKLSLQYKSFLYFIHPVAKYFGVYSGCRIREEAARKISFSFQNMPHHSDLNKVVDLPPVRRFRGLYYSIEDFRCQPFPEAGLSGKNILVGNSATNSNNHLDIFFQLKKFNLNGRQLIVPLNYGSKRYGRLINLFGKFLFKASYQGLLKYYPLEQYNRLLLSCNVMIFNHRRSQAFGNVLFGIWAGHKVFLRKQNPIYSYMKHLGIVVYAIDDQLTFDNLQSLPQDVQKENRRIIETYFNEAQIRKNYAELLDSIHKYQ